jgi:hypothetical protein
VNVCVCVCVRVCTHAYTHTHTHTHTLRKKEERFQGESDEEQHGKSRYVACDGISGFKYWVLKIISFRWTTGTAACMRACTRGSVQEAFRISRNKQRPLPSASTPFFSAACRVCDIQHAMAFLLAISQDVLRRCKAFLLFMPGPALSQRSALLHHTKQIRVRIDPSSFQLSPSHFLRPFRCVYRPSVTS